ncbi:MAG: YtpR family tRNA-binding protein [Enterococcus sp.]
MIFSYNKEHVGDTLMVVVADDQGKENQVTRVGNVARVQTIDDVTVAWNFFHISDHLSLEGNGQVTLTSEQIQTLNTLIKEAGFTEQFPLETQPKIVVGYVKTCVPHPDSDHLSITETEIGNGEVLQIVCGASNVKAEMKVVVATPGAMMPDGLMIWPGSLRGVESFGMLCSAKELHLPDAPEKKGILELPADAVVGEAFPVGK